MITSSRRIRGFAPLALVDQRALGSATRRCAVAMVRRPWWGQPRRRRIMAEAAATRRASLPAQPRPNASPPTAPARRSIGNAAKRVG